jgi:glycosyltransferase involved in cell wall biosynthesis
MPSEGHLAQIRELQARLADALREIARLREELERAARELFLLQASTSWRVTRPLRALREVALGRGTIRSMLHALRGTLKESVSRAQPPPPTEASAQRTYLEWTRRYDTLDAQRRSEIRTLLPSLPRQPLFSIVVPTYNTPERFLRAMIESVRAQLYPHWELCIADDASTDPAVKKVLSEYAGQDSRIRVTFRSVNGHISEASNTALEMARGEFIALLDHDDVIPEHALFMVARYIGRHPRGRLFYSDEDKLDAKGERTDPYFKTDWNPELILAQNFFSHFGVYETALAREAGGFRKGLEGSQDHDLVLRCIERAGHEAVIHVPHVLYHWRVLPGSTSAAVGEKPYSLSSAIRAVQEHLERSRVEAVVTLAIPRSNMLRVRYAQPAEPPKVSIVVVTRERGKLLEKCVESILARTVYSRYEILIVDHGSAAGSFDELVLRKNIRIIRDDRPLNRAAIVNVAAKQAEGEYLCLLDDNVEVISVDWLNELVSHAVRPHSGAVGAALWYPNGTLHHGGVVVGAHDLVAHMHHHLLRGDPGHFGRAGLVQNVSAVTGACLVVRKSIYEQVEGLDERLSAFSDIDLCLKLRQAGYRNIYTPFTDLIFHGVHERSPSEAALTRTKWGHLVAEDPFYNPNLKAGMGPLFTPAFPPRIAMLD